MVLIGLLRGSVIFMADLCRTITKPHELDFMTVSSYGGGTTSSRDVKILKILMVKFVVKTCLWLKILLTQATL